NRGKIVADGTAETLRNQASGGELLRVRIEDGAEADILAALNNLPSVEKATTRDTAMNRFEIQTRTGQSAKRELFHLCTQNGWVLTESIPLETRLEDIFRNLTMN